MATWVDEGCSKEKTMVTSARKKKKVDVMVKGAMKVSGAAGASKNFVEELAETCAEPGEVMTSPDLRGE